MMLKIDFPCLESRHEYISLIYSFAMNSSSKTVAETKAFKLWPWLASSGQVLNQQECESFYSYTYSYAGDDWGERLNESADNDEPSRTVFVYKICVENGFNGNGGKPSLCSVWKGLHTLVVCPLFKKGKAAKLNASYIDYFVSQHGLNSEEVKDIWNDIYNGPDRPEYEWAFAHFYNWIQDDRKHWESSFINSCSLITEPCKDKREKSLIRPKDNRDAGDTKEGKEEKKTEARSNKALNKGACLSEISSTTKLITKSKFVMKK
jgi:hypothetical protein